MALCPLYRPLYSTPLPLYPSTPSIRLGTLGAHLVLSVALGRYQSPTVKGERGFNPPSWVPRLDRRCGYSRCAMRQTLFCLPNRAGLKIKNKKRSPFKLSVLYLGARGYSWQAIIRNNCIQTTRTSLGEEPPGCMHCCTRSNSILTSCHRLLIFFFFLPDLHPRYP
jgi:hypothetical protein